MKTTLSVIKADVGGFPGHAGMHPDVAEAAEDCLENAVSKKTILDYRVMACGDDLELIMTHTKGDDSRVIHKLAWDTFVECTKIAKKLKLYGAGQDLLKSTFSGNVKGMGPGVAEMTFEERDSEPIVVFMADKTEPGAWNWSLYKIFADPFNTPGLVIDPSMNTGFIFEVHDVMKHRKVDFKTPEESYDLLAYIGAPSRYVIKSIRRKDGLLGAVSSTQRLSLIAGKYVGKDDPVCIVRSQHGLPALGEVTFPFTFPHIVAGWMRGSHHGPLMPVAFYDARPVAFDGPPRVIGAGFQIANGMMEGPVDIFDDPAFDKARDMSNDIMDMMRRHGPFEPHRLSMDEMEYTTLPSVEKKLESRFKKI